MGREASLQSPFALPAARLRDPKGSVGVRAGSICLSQPQRSFSVRSPDQRQRCGSPAAAGPRSPRAKAGIAGGGRVPRAVPGSPGCFYLKGSCTNKNSPQGRSTLHSGSETRSIKRFCFLMLPAPCLPADEPEAPTSLFPSLVTPVPGGRSGDAGTDLLRRSPPGPAREGRRPLRIPLRIPRGRIQSRKRFPEAAQRGSV